MKIMPEHSLLEFVKHYFSPNRFAQLDFSQKRPPYLFWTLFLVGFAFFHQYSLLGQLQLIETRGGGAINIQVTWFMAALVGVLVGLLLYFVLGSLFYSLMRLSGGRKGWRSGLNIYLYAYLPVSVFYLLIRAVNDLTDLNMALVWIGVRLLAVVYFFALLYVAARENLEVKKGRGFFLLVVLPVLFLLIFSLSGLI